MAEDGCVKKFVVQIPSVADVEQKSSARAQPLNFFRASSSSVTANFASLGAPEHARNSESGQGLANTFTEAFSFLRNTEFYSPPAAAPPPPSTSVNTPGAAAATASEAFRKEEAYAAAAQTGQARNAILVSRRQQGNSVLKHIRNARWMFSDIVPDYILGQNSCALYLSLRYHLLHPDYIYFRIRELQKSFRLRVVLCHVDVDDAIKPLHEVTKTCLLHDCSLLCAWSQEECARYLETIKIYENKPADYIQERTDSDYLSRLTSSLTTVRHVNKTDVLTLGSTFGTLSAIFNSSMEDLARCPGIGERKVKRLYDAFNEPFRRIPACKVRRQGNEASQVTEGAGLTPKVGEKDNSGGNTTGKIASGKDAIPPSKLINREDELSVREALNSVRGKVGSRSNLRSVGHMGSKTTGLNVDVDPTNQGTAQSVSDCIQENYVISLED